MEFEMLHDLYEIVNSLARDYQPSPTNPLTRSKIRWFGEVAEDILRFGTSEQAMVVIKGFAYDGVIRRSPLVPFQVLGLTGTLELRSGLVPMRKEVEGYALDMKMKNSPDTQPICYISQDYFRNQRKLDASLREMDKFINAALFMRTYLIDEHEREIHQPQD